MDLKVLILAMQKHKIDCKYVNDSLIEVNRISVYVHNDFAQFGTCKFKITDVYSLVSSLNQEDMINCNTATRHKIKATYQEMLHVEKIKT